LKKIIQFYPKQFLKISVYPKLTSKNTNNFRRVYISAHTWWTVAPVYILYLDHLKIKWSIIPLLVILFQLNILVLFLFFLTINILVLFMIIIFDKKIIIYFLEKAKEYIQWIIPQSISYTSQERGIQRIEFCLTKTPPKPKNLSMMCLKKEETNITKWSNIHILFRRKMTTKRKIPLPSQWEKIYVFTNY
jgi:hypothetical protein